MDNYIKREDKAFKREDKAFEEYAEYIMNDVSDEKIEDLFYEMGIEIDLNKSWDFDR